MAITPNELPTALARAKGDLSPFWLIHGEEPLLMLESADLIRHRARELAYDDRQVLELAGNSDWSQLMDSAAAVGMFAPRKLLEVRLPTGKPGVTGAKVIQRFLEMPMEGVVTVFSMPTPDWTASKAAWWQAMTKACTVIECKPVPREVLPRWLSERLAQNGQSAGRDALEAFADLVEGNLLAAKQEVAKIALLYPQGEVTREEIEACVGNSSRYGTDALLKAMWLGDPARAARIVDGLEAQEEPFPLVLMMITTQLRNLIKLSAAYARGESYTKGVFATNEMKRAARRIPAKRLESSLAVLADIDRLAKGLPVPKRDSDPWIELKSVCLFLAR